MQSTQPRISEPARAETNPGRRAGHAAARPDLYLFVHKGLRAFLSDTLHRCGRMDPSDDGDVAEALAQVRGLVEICRGHLHKEEDYLHPALEARRPGAARRTQDDHAKHLRAFADIEAGVRAVEQAHGAARVAAARDLYRHFALFVAENFEHMHVEETANNEVLWATHTDAELLALQKQIIGSIPPAEMQAALRWMIPAMAPAERALMLGGIKQNAPDAAFTGILAGLKPHLAGRDWDKLTAALAVP